MNFLFGSEIVDNNKIIADLQCQIDNLKDINMTNSSLKELYDIECSKNLTLSHELSKSSLELQNLNSINKSLKDDLKHLTKKFNKVINDKWSSFNIQKFKLHKIMHKQQLIIENLIENENVLVQRLKHSTFISSHSNHVHDSVNDSDTDSINDSDTDSDNEFIETFDNDRTDSNISFPPINSSLLSSIYNNDSDDIDEL